MPSAPRGEPPLSQGAEPGAMKPLLFVTGHVPPDRVGAFTRLHEREGLELALFGGPSRHGPAGLEFASATELPFPVVSLREHDAGQLAASGRFRAVVCSNAGRIALPATWAGARRAGVPLVLWTALWAHPRSAVHAFSYLALRRLYRSADAVVTYGPHVSAYVAARGARNIHVAPQSVDNRFWSARVDSSAALATWPQGTGTRFLFAGRDAPEKGLRTLLAAWSRAGLKAPAAGLALVGVGAEAGAGAEAGPGAGARAGMGDAVNGGTGAAAGVSRHDPVGAARLREIYAATDVLVVPSIATRTFREPWGLVVNEAMNGGVAVIASDAVGAVAGGLVRDGRNGLVVPAGDSDALAGALTRLAGDPELRARLGAAGARDVAAYSHDAWARGFSAALATLNLSRSHC
jgi:glycosyltransferase involved in cell wall biosynthesis